jgi:hypothetical protein
MKIEKTTARRHVIENLSKIMKDRGSIKNKNTITEIC